MKILKICFVILSFSAIGQDVVPVVDFNNYFRSFQNGFFRQLEFRPIKSYVYGDNIVAYVDTRSNLRVFEGDSPVDVSNVDAEYKVSDDLMTWRIGQTLNLWDKGDKRTLTYWAGYYEVKDSMVVYEDTRFNSLNVYLKGEIYTLATAVATLNLPDFVGENIVAFRDAGNVYKVFWNGQIYEIGAWHSAIEFEGGTDMLAFNDPIHGTFTMFEKGEFVDVQSFYADEYKVGNDVLLFTDLNGNLKYYAQGNLMTLSHFRPSFWDVKDEVVLWGENNVFYTVENQEKKELGRYIPSEYKIKNKVIAFKDIAGGVSVYADGKIKQLTQQQDAEFTIHGNSVLVYLFNKQFKLYHQGKIYNL